MNGIENIIKRIADEAEKNAAEIISRAEAEAAEIRADYDKKCAEKKEEIIARGESVAKEREDRLRGSLELAARKELLSKKQELISRAFDAAKKKLDSLSGDELTVTLSALALRAANGGAGEIILSPETRRACGEKVLEACAENKNIRLSPETREIGGGLILRDGTSEVNCSFAALVESLRDELSREISDILFG